MTSTMTTTTISIYTTTIITNTTTISIKTITTIPITVSINITTLSTITTIAGTIVPPSPLEPGPQRPRNSCPPLSKSACSEKPQNPLLSLRSPEGEDRQERWCWDPTAKSSGAGGGKILKCSIQSRALSSLPHYLHKNITRGYLISIAKSWLN